MELKDVNREQFESSQQIATKENWLPNSLDSLDITSITSINSSINHCNQ